jgi:hypothetical protein
VEVVEKSQGPFSLTHFIWRAKPWVSLEYYETVWRDEPHAHVIWSRSLIKQKKPTDRMLETNLRNIIKIQTPLNERSIKAREWEAKNGQVAGNTHHFACTCPTTHPPHTTAQRPF